ncbi:hypothetical protein LNO89_00760 [Klebsiella pneumoniae subsp. pneumoniae]|nr:hypothetical protein [Klebsiella pneumoniae subsp. pneumoniae]
MLRICPGYALSAVCTFRSPGKALCAAPGEGLPPATHWEKQHVHLS